MTNVNSPLKRVFITGALVSALSLSAIAAVSAQEATAVPDAPTEVTEQAAPGFLGVQISDADNGALVVDVLAGSPAEAAGVAVDDVITAVNGEVLTTAAQVAEAISLLMAGDEVSLTLERDGEIVDVTATLAARPVTGEDTAGASERPFFRVGGDVTLRFNADDQAWGVVELSEDAPLYADGLRSGDLIMAIDGSMYDPMALLGYVAGLGSDANLTLEVVRDGETIEVTVPAIDFLAGGMMNRRDGMMPFGEMPQGMPFGNMQEMPFGQFFRQQGQNQNGYLGVSFVTLDETVAAESGASLSDGALVVEVVADSPAAAAGLQADDIITAVNGEPVDAEHTLRDRLIAYEAGDVLMLTVVRSGDEQQIEVTLGEPTLQAGMGQMFQVPMAPGMMNPHGQGGYGSGSQSGRGQQGQGSQNGQQLPPGHPSVPAQPEATPETSGAAA